MTSSAAAAVSVLPTRPTSQVGETPPEVSLVSLYTLDGGAVVDSESGVNGTVVGSWLSTVTDSLVSGVSGQSFYKYGGAAHITLPASQAAHALTEMSLSFYYQPAAHDDEHALLAVGDGSQVGDLYLAVRANGRLYGWHVGTGPALRFFESSAGVAGTNLEAGTAYRITLIFGPPAAKLYLDGVEVAAIPQNTNGWNNARTKFIGTQIDGATKPMQGAIDHIRIWQGVLQPSGIGALEAATSIALDTYAPIALAINNLVAYWRLSDVTDAVGALNLTEVGGSGGGSVGPLEPVDENALAVAITVGTDPRQSWIGYGWGAGAGSAIGSQGPLATHVTKLCEDLNAKVIRTHAPINVSTYVSRYKTIWDTVTPHGVDTLFVSHYMYASAGGGSTNPTGEADALKSTIDQGVGAGAAFIATSLQNEPDGGSQNNPYGSPDFSAGVLTDQLNYHNRLNAIGLGDVIRLGLEWRHPPDSGRIPREFDDTDAAGRIGTVLQQGCSHTYNKAPNQACYDQRWKLAGTGIWSCETGDMNSPRAQAIFVTDVNNGVVVELAHIGIADAGASDLRQFLYASNGAEQPYVGGIKVLSRELVRGTVMRHCTSSDRPSGLPVTQAENMLWHSGTSQRQPRQQVFCGKRTDNRWVVGAVSYAFGSDSPTSFAGGHYGSAGNQQLTVTIPELAGQDVVFSGRRATQGGTVSSTTVNCKNGVLRFTLAPAETIALTSEVAGSGGGLNFTGAPLPAQSTDPSLILTPTQYCEVAHDVALALPELSVVFWCKPASLHDGAVVSKRTTPGTAPVEAQDWTVRTRTDGAITSFGYDGATTVNAPTDAGIYSAGQTIAAAVLLGGGGAMALYIDGLLEAENEDYTLGWDANNSTLRIGYAGYDAHPFNGQIDEVMIFSRRITADEVRTLHRTVAVAGSLAAGTVEETGSPVSVDLATIVQARSTATFGGSAGSSNFGSWGLVGSVLTYTPTDTGLGTDTYNYTVDDGDLGSAGATVSVEVVAEAPAPEDNYAAEVAGITNLVAYWRLGDASAGTLADSSGNGHTGSYTGSPSFRVADLTEAWQASDGFAVNCAGTGHGTVAHNAAFALAQGSIGFWFRVNSLSSTVELITKGTGLRIRVTTAGALECLIGSMTLATIAGMVGAGEDHHCMVSWTPKMVYLWLDGRYVDKTPGLSQMGSWPTTKHTTGLTGNSSTWRFGGSSGGTSQNVRLDEVALYSRSLTFEELTTLSMRLAGLGYDPAGALDTINVSTASGLSSAISSAIPGDHIVLANATYSGNFNLTANGTRANPIVIRSANGPNNCTISGTGIDITGDWCILDGVTIAPSSHCRLFGEHSRLARIRRVTRNGLSGIEVEGGANFSRVDHCFVGHFDPNETAAAGKAALKVNVDAGSGAADNPWYFLADHSHFNSDKASDPIPVTTNPIYIAQNRNSLGMITVYKCLNGGASGSDTRRGTELKNSAGLMLKCTESLSPGYAQNRHGMHTEWRSCYFRKDYSSQGRDHLVIGCTFDGSGRNLRLPPGNALEADYLEAPWGTGAGSRPASQGVGIIGCRFLNGAIVQAGEPPFDTGVDAREAYAEGNTNWSVTYSSADYIGTITHAGTTTEPFEVAVELGSGDVGLNAVDPLVPPGWK